MAKVAEQLNQKKCSVTRFKIHDGMFAKEFLGSGGKKLTPTAKRILALVNSLTKKGKPAFLTYRNYNEVLESSDKATCKGLSRLKEADLIEQDKSNRSYSKYTVKKKPKGKGYTTYDKKYFEIIDEHAKKPVRWRRSSVQLLACRLIRHLISEGKEWFVASHDHIANMLGISKRSAQNAVDHLMYCKVIFRPKEYKGKYAGKASAYRFGSALTDTLRKYENQQQEEAKQKAKAKRAKAKRTSSDAVGTSEQAAPQSAAERKKIARERYWAARREKAYKRANKYETLAMGDAAYKNAMETIRKDEIELARAEVHAPETVREIQIRLNKAHRERADALLRLHLTEEDLLPYDCKKCEDSGYLPNGRMCNCYSSPPRGAP